MRTRRDVFMKRNVLYKAAAAFLSMMLVISCVCLKSPVELQAANDGDVIDRTTYVVKYYSDISGYAGVNPKVAPKIGYGTGDNESKYLGYLFAGWYTDEACTTHITANSGAGYAKFVPADVLSIGTQASPEKDGKRNLRFITTVEGSNYDKVGIDVRYYKDGVLQTKGTKENGGKALWKKIRATYEDESNTKSATIFSASSTHFATYLLTDIPSSLYDTNFYAKPYWITKDGTKVYGIEKVVTVRDGDVVESGTVNGTEASYCEISVPVRVYSNDAGVNAGIQKVTFAKTDFEYVGFSNYAIGTMQESKVENVKNGVFEQLAVRVDTSDNEKVVITVLAHTEGAANVTADGMYINLRLKARLTNGALPHITDAIQVENVYEDVNFCDSAENKQTVYTKAVYNDFAEKN